MSECSQTNVPVIQIVEDPCKGTHTASSCIFHIPSIVALSIQGNSSLQEIITALVGVIQQQASSINQLEDTATPKYKVYTALLTQSGGDSQISFHGLSTIIGVTYFISNNSNGADFTIIGSPNNEIGTHFVATGTTPNWGTGTTSELTYNEGAPVVTVLENTIGNIWFTYNGDGDYGFNSNGLFIENKSISFITPNYGNDYNIIGVGFGNTNSGEISTINASNLTQGANNLLYNTPIEIRVYN